MQGKKISRMHINMFQFVPIITILQYLIYGATKPDSVSFQQLKKKKKKGCNSFCKCVSVHKIFPSHAQVSSTKYVDAVWSVC